MLAAPEFVIVTGIAALVVDTCCEGKVSVLAERETAPTVAGPLKPTVGAAPAELFTLNVATRTPPAVGVKVTLNAQLAPAPKDPRHADGTEKSPGATPPRDRDVIVTAVVLLFVTVTDWLPLVLPTVSVAKTTSIGDNVRAGKTPTPAVCTF